MAATRLPLPPKEPPAQARPEGLAPKFRDAVMRVIGRMRAEGFDPVIREGLRTDARQRWLYGFGREWDDGRGQVTNSPTGEDSWHPYGLAADIVDRVKEDKAPPAFWDSLARAARAEGLVTGADWKRKDGPHVQFGHPMRVSPSPRATALKVSGGNLAVWREVGAADDLEHDAPA